MNAPPTNARARLARWAAHRPGGARGRLEARVERWSEPLFALATLTWLWSLSVQARVPASTALLTMAGLTLVRGLGTPGGRAEVAALPGRPDYYLPAGLVVAYLAVFAWTPEPALAWERVEAASQLLLLPVAFFVWRGHLRRWRGAYRAAAVGFAAASAAAVAGYALANHDALVVALGQGRAVPVPRGQHVTYAAFLAFASLAGLDAAARGPSGSARVWGGACACVTAAALHLIAVRTGLVLCYLGVAGYGLRLALARMRPLPALGVVAAGVAVVAAAAAHLPGVERRLAYARYDLERAFDARADANSDGGRVLSFRASAAVIADDPWRGAGPRGMGAAMNREYDRMGHGGARHSPTNQWLFSWTHAGALGFLGVWLALLAPLAERGWRRRPLVAEWVAMTAAWWTVEPPLATAAGPGVALAFLLLAKAPPLPAAVVDAGGGGDADAGR